MGLGVAGVASTLFLVEAWVKRKKKGAAWCRANKIGPLRAELSAPPLAAPDVVILRGERVNPAVMYAEARELLALHCHVCGACDWGRRPP